MSKGNDGHYEILEKNVNRTLFDIKYSQICCGSLRIMKNKPSLTLKPLVYQRKP